MRCADSVYIKLLHPYKVIHKIVIGHIPTLCGVSVVVIDALELHRNTVYAEGKLAVYRIFNKSDFAADNLALTFKNKLIEVRLFRVPFYASVSPSIMQPCSLR